jgi:hypothetical protein
MSPRAFHEVEGFPWWMNTRWGRWLCAHWHPAATLWRTLMAVKFYEEAKADLEWRTAELQRAANACVVRDFSEDGRRELTRAWCGWRNARDAEHREAEAVAGCKLWREELEDPAWLREADKGQCTDPGAA